MKKSEFTQITRIIEYIIKRELEKQLPPLISEILNSNDGKKSLMSEQKTTANVESISEEIPKDNLRANLRELFAGVTPAEKGGETHTTRPFKQYTKNSILNQVLNETVPDLRLREGQ